MRDHELELIAALAEGRLDDETEARALIASSPEARAEYEVQKQALHNLQSLGSAAMTEAERATLHRDLWTELRASPSSTSARTPWYYRLVPVAAGMFVVIALVAVINDGGGDETIETSQRLAATETTQADAATDTDATVAPSESTPESADGEQLAPVIETESDENDSGGAEEAMTQDFAGVAEAENAAYYQAEADEMRAAEAPTPPLAADEGAPEEMTTCIADAGLEGYELLGTFPTPFLDVEEGREVPEGVVPYLAAIPEGGDPATSPIAFIDLASCEVLLIDR